MKSIRVLKNVFEKNDSAAEDNRRRFDAKGVTCVNLLGGAGAGKTTILENLLPIITKTHRVAVLEGDLATTKDADRIAALNVPVVQLLTDGGCHLNATLVEHALDDIPVDELDLLVVENVGNPICPANFDLGEHLRISVLSVTEGDDKPSKYPLLFKDVAAVVLSKCDLLPYTNFRLDQVQEDIRRINPNAIVFQTDIKTPSSFDELAVWVLERCKNLTGTSG